MALFMGNGCFGPKEDVVIKYIVPKDYRGIYVLYLDPQATEIPKKNSEGEYVVQIPPNGKLKLRSFDVFNTWHKKKAVFDDDNSCPVFGFGEKSLEAIALQPEMSSHTGGEVRIYGFIGTRNEAIQAYNQEGLGPKYKYEE
jgi:hypothetical protein